MVGHGHALPLELAKTVVEIAEVAWSALEHRRESKNHVASAGEEEKEEISRLRSENLHLRVALVENLQILGKIIQDHEEDCPSDLYARLEAVVDSSSFLTKLESLHQESNALPNDSYPLIEAKGSSILLDLMLTSSHLGQLMFVSNYVDLVKSEVVELAATGGHGEPNHWVWVTENIVPDKIEEASGIDNENYVLVSEENVVDGIAEFIAKCVHENPKAKVLKPEELQRRIRRVLGSIRDRSKLKYMWEAGKVIYALSTWGICLAGLYHGRAVVKAAAVGVHAASKFAVKAL